MTFGLHSASRPIGASTLALATAALCAQLAAQGPAARSIRIDVVSSRPELVTGDSALVRVEVPDRNASQVLIAVNGRDITSDFKTTDGGSATRSGEGATASRPGGTVRLGLVTGLTQGENTITVKAAGGAPVSARLTAYPDTGPVIAGPHEQPFICETDEFKLQTGERLGAALDDNCSVKTRVDYVYRTAGKDAWQRLPALTAIPADAASVTTSTGQTVPYVVRIETGTINRAVYQIAMLHDPRQPAPDVWTRSRGWNERLLYTFGGGCPGGWYRQGTSTGGVDDDAMLREGYAVASASLNVFGNNSNDLLAGETMLMVKVSFIEAYGAPLFTIGWGCSGGSYQAHQIGDNYPGLLDGIIIGCSFPDVGYTSISVHSFGARLMYNYFQHASIPWTRDQQVAASGLPNYDSLQVQGTRPDRIRPRDVCDDSIPPAMVYHPIGNPRGARCTVYDHTVNVYGKDPATGAARRFLDNVGVQYGLQALNDGTITKAQFLDLNEHIGGIDADADLQSARTTGDRKAIEVAYASGRILSGGGGLATMPIIDYRGYADYAKGDPHMRFYSFSTRERLRRANGDANNQVMIVEDGAKYGLFSSKSPQLRQALKQMDGWLTAIQRDSAPASHARVVRNKPADLVDACFDANGTKIVETQTLDGAGRCNALYPSHRSPYLVAGMPIANDVLKCQLKPVAASDYREKLSEEEMTRLRRIFPDGVCDYSKPGVAQQRLKGTWLSFGPSAANRVATP
jgi:hypothetical protein